jgi:ribosome-associated protein
VSDLSNTSNLALPDDELTFRFSRSSGPGGQNVNTRDTRVEVIFDVAQSRSLTGWQRERAIERLGGRLDEEGRLHVVASDARTQGRNRELAVSRLRAILSEALQPPPDPRRPTRPSAAAQERRIANKRARGELKKLRRPIPEDE